MKIIKSLMDFLNFMINKNIIVEDFKEILI